MIDTLPPGLYEAVIEPRPEGTVDSDHGEWIMRCEARTLDDIRALGGNDAADERRFAAVDRRVAGQSRPVPNFRAALRAGASPIRQTAEMMRQMHPLRLQYEIFSNANPDDGADFSAGRSGARKPPRTAAPDNPFIKLQENMSRQIDDGARRAGATPRGHSLRRRFWPFTARRRCRPHWALTRRPTQPQRKAAKSALHQALKDKRIAELRSKIAVGGLREATHSRSPLSPAWRADAVDERGFEVVRRMRKAHADIPLSAFKATVREQFYMLLIDQEAALAAIPGMLPDDPDAPAQGV